MDICKEDLGTIRTALRVAIAHSTKDRETKGYRLLLSRLEGVPKEAQDGFQYDYNDNQWMI